MGAGSATNVADKLSGGETERSLWRGSVATAGDQLSGLQGRRWLEGEGLPLTARFGKVR